MKYNGTHGILAFDWIRISFQFDDILQFGWQEVNQGTRNIIQQNVNQKDHLPWKNGNFYFFQACSDHLFLLQLDCCGWEGPKEFAYTSEPIDDSCYENVGGGPANSGVLARSDDQFSTKKMKQVSC